MPLLSLKSAYLIAENNCKTFLDHERICWCHDWGQQVDYLVRHLERSSIGIQARIIGKLNYDLVRRTRKPNPRSFSSKLDAKQRIISIAHTVSRLRLFN